MTHDNPDAYVAIGSLGVPDPPVGHHLVATGL